MDGSEASDIYDGERGNGNTSLPRLPRNERAAENELLQEINAPSTPRKKKRVKATSNKLRTKNNGPGVFPVGNNDDWRTTYHHWITSCNTLQRDASRLAKVLRAEEILERTIRRRERIDPERLQRRTNNGEPLRLVRSLSPGFRTDTEDYEFTQRS